MVDLLDGFPPHILLEHLTREIGLEGIITYFPLGDVLAVIANISTDNTTAATLLATLAKHIQVPEKVTTLQIPDWQMGENGISFDTLVVQLSSTEAQVFRALLERKPNSEDYIVCSKNNLEQALFRVNAQSADCYPSNYMNVVIFRIRSYLTEFYRTYITHLEKPGRKYPWIKTIRGIGYQLIEVSYTELKAILQNHHNVEISDPIYTDGQSEV